MGPGPKVTACVTVTPADAGSVDAAPVVMAAGVPAVVWAGVGGGATVALRLQARAAEASSASSGTRCQRVAGWVFMARGLLNREGHDRQRGAAREHLVPHWKSWNLGIDGLPIGGQTVDFNNLNPDTPLAAGG